MTRYDRYCRHCRDLVWCRGEKNYRRGRDGGCRSFAPSRETVQMTLEMYRPYIKEEDTCEDRY